MLEILGGGGGKSPVIIHDDVVGRLSDETYLLRGEARNVLAPLSLLLFWRLGVVCAFVFVQIKVMHNLTGPTYSHN